MMNWFFNLIKQHGFLSMFLGGLIEEIIIPIPSPLVAITGGTLLIKQKNLIPALLAIFTKVSLPYSIGATIGSTFAYSITYFGGKLMVDKLENFLGFSWKLVEKIREKYIKGSGDELAITILRAIPVIPVSLISAVGGVVRYNLKSFYFYTFLGLIIRSLILALIGWQTGHTYEIWIEGLNKLESIISLVILVILGSLLAWLYLKRKAIIKKLDS